MCRTVCCRVWCWQGHAACVVVDLCVGPSHMKVPSPCAPLVDPTGRKGRMRLHAFAQRCLSKRRWVILLQSDLIAVRCCAVRYAP